tara:strand:+ start:4564 stop:6057 length:1494 start_codon:yes stop_codon:yes gene_type:complete
MYVWNWDIEIPLLIEKLSNENSQRVWNEFYINDPLEDPKQIQIIERNIYLANEFSLYLFHVYNQVLEILKLAKENSKSEKNYNILVQKAYELFLNYAPPIANYEFSLKKDIKTITPLAIDPYSLGLPFLSNSKWIRIFDSESSIPNNTSIIWNTQLFDELHIEISDPITVEIDMDKSGLIPSHFYKYNKCLRYIFELDSQSFTSGLHECIVYFKNSESKVTTQRYDTSDIKTINDYNGRIPSVNTTATSSVTSGIIITYTDTYKLLEYSFILPQIPYFENNVEITTYENYDSIFILCDPTPHFHLFPIFTKTNIVTQVSIIDETNINITYGGGTIQYRQISQENITNLTIVFVYQNKLYIPVNEELLKYSPMFIKDNDHISYRIIFTGTPETEFKIVLEIPNDSNESLNDSNDTNDSNNNDYTLPSYWGGLKFAFKQDDDNIIDEEIQMSIDKITTEKLHLENLMKILENENKIHKHEISLYKIKYQNKLKNIEDLI